MKTTNILRAGLAAGLLGALLGLGACAIGQAQSDAITTTLTQLGNTLTSDLQNQRNAALAATPADIDGAACAGTLPDPAHPENGTGAMAVAGAIQKLNASLAGKPIGALTVAEVASLYQPGSAQFNWAVKTLESACIAKVHDVNQATNSTAGIIAALPSILVLAGAPLGG